MFMVPAVTVFHMRLRSAMHEMCLPFRGGLAQLTRLAPLAPLFFRVC